MSSMKKEIFTVRLFVPGVDAKFDAKCSSFEEAVHLRKVLEESFYSTYDGSRVADTVIIPPKDGGKTSGTVLRCSDLLPPAPPAPPAPAPSVDVDVDVGVYDEDLHLPINSGFYSLEPYGYDWVIRCEDWNASHYRDDCELVLNFEDPNAVAFWDEEAYGFVLDDYYYKYAKECIEEENHIVEQQEIETEDDWLMDYNDTKWETNTTAEIYTLKSTKRGYIIYCDSPDECEFYKEPLIALTQDLENGPTAVWDEESQGWLVNRRERKSAEEFIRVANGRGDW